MACGERAQKQPRCNLLWVATRLFVSFIVSSHQLYQIVVLDDSLYIRSSSL